MKTLHRLLLLCLLSLGGGLALAHEGGHAQDGLRTVTLEVDGMTCRMCPLTVKKALRRLPGVVAVEAKI